MIIIAKLLELTAGSMSKLQAVGEQQVYLM